MANRGELAAGGGAHLVGLHVAHDCDAPTGGASVADPSASLDVELPDGGQLR
jgi:hypothetical protein